MLVLFEINRAIYHLDDLPDGLVFARMCAQNSSGVFAREFTQIGRTVEIGVASGQLISVSFPDTLTQNINQTHPLLDRISAYLDGAQDSFNDVAIALTVPTTERRVLLALRKVSYGESVTVSRLTRMSGGDPDSPDDLEQVITALRENPIPIIIADHRVEGGPYATPSRCRDQLQQIENKL